MDFINNKSKPILVRGMRSSATYHLIDPDSIVGCTEQCFSFSQGLCYGVTCRAKKMEGIGVQTSICLGIEDTYVVGGKLPETVKRIIAMRCRLRR